MQIHEAVSGDGGSLKGQMRNDFLSHAKRPESCNEQVVPGSETAILVRLAGRTKRSAHKTTNGEAGDRLR